MSDEPTPVESALHTLSEAATLPELIEAHRTLRRKIRASRLKQSSAFGPLATAYGEMVTLSDEMKANGATFEERQYGIDATLRQMWPFTRAWKYLCDRCNDTGLVMRICRDGDRCDGVSTRADSAFQPAGKFARLCTLSPDYEHEYGQPCLCSLGSRFRERPKHESGDFSNAGRGSQKPTRVGRR